MTTCSYIIVGGDYEHGGAASRNLKEMLKSVGVDAQAIRRIMIAAYEAEMNVIIHAYHGRLVASIVGAGDSSEVVVDVVDEGPGIPDIPLAMKEGYSTAPARARALGFGAGLGLPNIKKHSDTFAIDSTVGQGTRVHFGVKFAPEPAFASAQNSMRIHGELCRQCLQCIQLCPTRALRVHRGVPSILGHLCIDCTACIESCPTGALMMEGAEALPDIFDAPLLLPPAVLFQFGPRVEPERVLEALALLGFGDVRLTTPWEEALDEAVHAEAAGGAALPVITPACAAVVSLIATRFPSLLAHVAPFVTPLEAALRDISSARALSSDAIHATDPGPGAITMNAAAVAAGAPTAPIAPGTPAVAGARCFGASDASTAKQAAAVIVCPGQRTALLASGIPPRLIVSAQGLRKALWPLLNQRAGTVPVARPGPHAAAPSDPATLSVSGIRHVQRTLEDLENGFLSDVRVLELFACEHGCFGSGTLKGANAAIALHQWRCAPWLMSPGARAHRRTAPLSPRPGLRLDGDMKQAMAKLARIDEVLRTLPGRDCGQCGAPTCRHFAEDIVLDRIGKKACVYLASIKKESDKERP